MGRSLSTPDANSGVSTIPTAVGFTAGDYVYQTALDNGPIPSGALSTGAFPFNSVPAATYPMTATAASNLTYIEQDGGSTGGQVAAKLANGNIVFVYIKCTGAAYLGTPYFKIVDAAGATVVAETAMDTQTVGGAHSISVCVLPNNNFVAVWTKQSTGINYTIGARIYSQTGTAVTAALSFAGAYTVSVQGALLKVKPRSDNSFIVMAYSSNTVYFIAANAAGIISGFASGGAYGETVNNSSYQSIDYAITSNDFVHIFKSDPTALNALTVRTLNTSGVQTSNVTIVSGINVNNVSCVLMPSGNVNVFFTSSTAGSLGIWGYSWNGFYTAVIGSGRLVTFSVAGLFFGFLNSYAQGSGGNFTLFYSHSDINGAVGYQTFNSSGALLSPSVAQTIPGITNPLGSWKQFAIFDIGSSTRVYTGAKSNTYTQPVATENYGGPRGIYYFSYDTTSYAISNNSTASLNYGNLGSFGLGAYARSVSTPISASFFAATTGSYTVNIPAGTNLIGKTIIDSLPAQSISATTLANGDVAILYVSAVSPYGASVVIYNTSGAVVTTVAVAATAHTATYCSIAPYANGSFAVFYRTAATTITWKVYNSSYAQVATGTLTDAISGGLDDNGFFNAASYGNGTNVAFAYRGNTNPIRVGNLSNSGTYTAVATWTISATLPQVIGFKSNVFSVVAVDQGGTYLNYLTVTYYQTGAASWASQGSTGVGINSSSSSILDSCHSSSVPAPDNNTLCVYYPGAGATIALACADTDFWNGSNWAYTSGGALPPIFSTNTLRYNALGYTGDGMGVLATSLAQGANSLGYTRVAAANSSDGFWAGNSASVGTGVNTGLQTSANAGNRSLSIAPFVGGSCVIAYLDNNNRPCFFAPIVTSYPVSRTLTAGVDISTTTLSLTAESGYVLRGVALTTAAAGSSGTVQTRGNATVSSSYPAGTPATNFDFRTSTSLGVRGRVTGRNVTMEA